jgi:hypothetical protein
MISSPGFPSVVFVLLLSTTLADFERRGISQISFSVTHGWSAFGGADHGWQETSLDVGPSRFWIGWGTRRGARCVRSTYRG